MTNIEKILKEIETKEYNITLNKLLSNYMYYTDLLFELDERIGKYKDIYSETMTQKVLDIVLELENKLDQYDKEEI